jgi:ATP-binding cassette subfamily B (MDR/TAP) protein 1
VEDRKKLYEINKVDRHQPLKGDEDEHELSMAEAEFFETMKESQKKQLSKKVSFDPSLKKRKKEVELEKRGEEVKLKHVNVIIERIAKREEERIEEEVQGSAFSQIWPFSVPKGYVYFGLLITLLHGALFPILGIFIVKGLMAMQQEDKSEIQKDSDKIILMMALLGVLKIFTSFGSKFLLGIVGENLAFTFRMKLYKNYISKHIGFYDEPENSASKVCSSLSGDATIINGAGADGIAVQMEAKFGMLSGIVIGFIFSWKMAIVCTILTPMMNLASIIRARFQFDSVLKNKMEEGLEAQLANDCFTNHKTISSFSQNKLITTKFN